MFTILAIIKQTKKIILENSGTTIAGILTTAFSIIILGTFSLFYINVISMSQVFLNLNHYSLFLDKDITEVEREFIHMSLKKTKGISQITELSSKQALESLLGSFGENSNVIYDLEVNPLPDIIEFKSEKVLAPEMKKKIESFTGVTELIHGKETLEQIETFFTIANFIGWLMICLLSISVIFITANSIKIALFSRLPEIEVFKVLGATPEFIRWPYLLEGFVISCTGFLLGITGVFIIYKFVIAGITYSPATSDFRTAAQFFTFPQMGIILAFIIALGIYGASIATKKIFRLLAI